MHKLPTVRDPESAIKGRETYQAAVEHRRRDQFNYKPWLQKKRDAGGSVKMCPRWFSAKAKNSQVQLTARLQRTLDPLPHRLEAQLGVPLKHFAAATRA